MNILRRLIGQKASQRYLYIFIDVSGNYDFLVTGSKYIIFTSLSCADIQPGTLELYKLKHEICGWGINLEYFHATDDLPPVRERVFDVLSKLTHVRIDSVVVGKRDTQQFSFSLQRFYPKIVSSLLEARFNVAGIDALRFDKVFIFMDREHARSIEREAMIKAVKLWMSRRLKNERVRYFTLMHQSKSHPYLQLVDYCSWAIFRKWERTDYMAYAKIERLIKTEVEISSDEALRPD